MESADSDVASCLETDLAMSEEDESIILDHWLELPSRNPPPPPPLPTFLGHSAAQVAAYHLHNLYQATC
ncbi:hypothetical protein Pmani_006478 [Petrolisthes manimaculis]|uniref:Uncharacterized protein n=1 Tax=Petrolisthes manimaculis TaxID=1843537 RepID=A0AAE1QBN8_9EUCA|nr:hypothetical protein Pmani_006478 [Petrolisthes manimaculis]